MKVIGKVASPVSCLEFGLQHKLLPNVPAFAKEAAEKSKQILQEWTKKANVAMKRLDADYIETVDLQKLDDDVREARKSGDALYAYINAAKKHLGGGLACLQTQSHPWGVGSGWLASTM